MSVGYVTFNYFTDQQRALYMADVVVDGKVVDTVTIGRMNIKRTRPLTDGYAPRSFGFRLK